MVTGTGCSRDWAASIRFAWPGQAPLALAAHTTGRLAAQRISLEVASFAAFILKWCHRHLRITNCGSVHLVRWAAVVLPAPDRFASSLLVRPAKLCLVSVGWRSGATVFPGWFLPRCGVGSVCCLGWPPRPRHLPPCRAGRLAGRLASDRWPSSPPRPYPSHITSPYWARAVPRPAKRAPPTSSLASCSSCCSCSLPPRRWSRAGSTRDWST